jgi:hypothetical protein
MARMHGFSRKRGGGVRLTLDPAEASVLDHLLDQLTELLQPDASDTHDDDPLASMVGISTATETPDDPALARLLPDAYRDDDEAAAEFRRYTELGLRESKLAQATTARATLADAEAVAGDRLLTEEEVDAWLRTLNDLRLTLGTRLDVSEDLDAEEARLATLPPDDPRVFLHEVYDWLGYLQSTLLRAMG